jgi:hypothetical protein
LVFFFTTECFFYNGVKLGSFSKMGVFGVGAEVFGAACVCAGAEDTTEDVGADCDCIRGAAGTDATGTDATGTDATGTDATGEKEAPLLSVFLSVFHSKS